MPKQYWSENEPDGDLDPISSFLSEWSDPEEEEEEFRSDFFQGLSGRRQKAALVLTLIWGMMLALHWLSWGSVLVLGFTGLLLLQSIRLIAAKPESTPDALDDRALEKAPMVSLLVAAKNEETVISQLVKVLCNLDYPSECCEVWVIDDHSTDKTPEILDKLVTQYPQLRVIHRPAGAGGGKSGALNQVLPLTTGEFIGVFDADAGVPQDLLRRVIPLFATPEMGAVQVRKAIANESVNFWTQGQTTEMAIDGYFQEQRIAIGGIGELRGNGQFVRRRALNSCGGWNEQTITDDLDLTIRLHLDHWKIGFLRHPEVEEEGVTRAIALWHQRNRWAEGGYQRYLDYWRFIFSKRLGFNKKLDLFFFLLMQYLLPTAAIPDLVLAIAFHHLPILTPVTTLMLSISGWGMLTGLRRLQPNQSFSLSQLAIAIGQTIRGIVYMFHWFIIIPSITARMSIRQKRLKWVKTSHEGTGEENLEFEEV